MDPVTFPTKIDAWLLAVLVGSALSCLAGGWVVVRRTGGLAGWAGATMLVVVGSGLPLWFVTSTHYTIDAVALHVRSGPFEWHVRLAQIRQVTPTRNPASSPALSLDRLRIDYGANRAILISPRDTDAFLSQLQMRRGG